jgi:hypothetical protein
MGKRIIGSYTSLYWKSEISSTSVRNSIFHEWKDVEFLTRVEEIPDLQ